MEYMYSLPAEIFTHQAVSLPNCRVQKCQSVFRVWHHSIALYFWVFQTAIARHSSFAAVDLLCGIQKGLIGLLRAVVTGDELRRLELEGPLAALHIDFAEKL